MTTSAQARFSDSHGIERRDTISDERRRPLLDGETKSEAGGALTMGDRAADIRAGLKHPVIDGDGHWLEPIPVFLEYLAEAGGPSAVDRMREIWNQNDEWYRSTGPERQHKRLRRTIWWGVTTNTY